MRKALTALAALAAVAMLAVGLVNTPVSADFRKTSSSSKVTCHGDYCTGQYPSDTNCDIGAQTVRTSKILHTVLDIGGNAYNGLEGNPRVIEVGTLKLRYSPTCGTVWAYADVHDPIVVTKISVGQEHTNHMEHHVLRPNRAWYNRNDDEFMGRTYSPQIYTRGLRSIAFISGDVADGGYITKWW